MSDIENMDVILGTGEYNQTERDIGQMTGFSNMLNRDEIEVIPRKTMKSGIFLKIEMILTLLAT